MDGQLATVIPLDLIKIVVAVAPLDVAGRILATCKALATMMDGLVLSRMAAVYRSGSVWSELPNQMLHGFSMNDTRDPIGLMAIDFDRNRPLKWSFTGENITYTGMGGSRTVMVTAPRRPIKFLTWVSRYHCMTVTQQDDGSALVDLRVYQGFAIGTPNPDPWAWYGQFDTEVFERAYANLVHVVRWCDCYRCSSFDALDVDIIRPWINSEMLTRFRPQASEVALVKIIESSGGAAYGLICSCRALSKHARRR